MSFSPDNNRKIIDRLQRQLDDVLDNQLYSIPGNDLSLISESLGKRNSAHGSQGGNRSSQPTPHEISEIDLAGTLTGVFDNLIPAAETIILDNVGGIGTNVTLKNIHQFIEGQILKITPAVGKVIDFVTGGNIALPSGPFSINDQEMCELQYFKDTNKYKCISTGSTGSGGLATAGGTMIGPIAYLTQTGVLASDRLDVSQATGAYTSKIIVVAESGTTDNLIGIDGAAFDGQVLILQGVIGATITIKHMAVGGNIRTFSGTDIMLTGNQNMQFSFDTASSEWAQVGGGSTGSGAGLADPARQTRHAITPVSLPGKTQINWTTGSVFTILLDRDIELEFLSPPPVDQFQLTVIEFTQNGVGNHSVTFPAEVLGGPDVSQGANNITAMAIYTYDNGMTYKFENVTTSDARRWSEHPATQVIELANNSFNNFVGYIASAGRAMSVGAGGITWDLPNGDDYTFRVNAQDQMTIAENLINVHNHSFSNYLGWTASPGQAFVVNSLGNEYTLPAGDRVLYTINAQPQMTIQENLINLHGHSLGGMIGYTGNIPGQALILDGAGLTHDLPASDQYNFRINGVSHLVVSAAGSAFNAPLSMNNQKITSVSDPTNPQDVMTKNYFDNNRVVSLNDLSNVTLATLLDEQILQYNSTTGQFENVDPNIIAGVTELDDLSDVTIGTPTGNHVLRHDGAKFINDFLDLGHLGDVIVPSPVDKHYLKHDGSNWVNSFIVKGDLPVEVALTDRVNNFTQQNTFAGAGTSLVVTNKASLNGNVDLGSDDNDNIDVNGIIQTDIVILGDHRIRSSNGDPLGFFTKNETGTIGGEGTIQAPHDAGPVPGTKGAILNDFGDFPAAIGFYFNNGGAPVLTIRRPDGDVTAVTFSTAAVTATDIT